MFTSGKRRHLNEMLQIACGAIDSLDEVSGSLRSELRYREYTDMQDLRMDVANALWSILDGLMDLAEKIEELERKVAD